MLALILALLALMSFLMMLVTLLIGVKLANELAAAEQAMSKRAAVLIPITSHAHSRPHSSGPLPLAGRVFGVCGRSAVLWRSSV